MSASSVVLSDFFAVALPLVHVVHVAARQPSAMMFPRLALFAAALSVASVSADLTITNPTASSWWGERLLLSLLCTIF